MPCRTDPDDYRCSNDTTAKKLDELTQLLCSVCNRLDEKDSEYFPMNPQLDRWWSEHKEEDRKRRIAELKVKQARDRAESMLAKPWNSLTQAEKEFLKRGNYLV